MKLRGLLALGISLATAGAWAIPSPDTYARAELQAMLEHQPVGNKYIFWGTLDSINRTGRDANYNNIYEVRSDYPGGKMLCVNVTVHSEMAPPVGMAKSSDEVVAEVVDVSAVRDCP